ncbi:MAG: hypothetical protein CYPHOPRED_003371 [Cyphobasidiales sp. Tagirdzhanova-0007]|nr:MAG: hypothetical protein CYPHOPRED_003371 [Cyphobasidiales sp. Tagirdzhanova-0007]
MYPSRLIRAEGIIQGSGVSQSTKTKPNARFAPTFRHARVNVAGITPSLVVRWIPILSIWGVGAAAGLALYLSDIPKFKNDVLFKVPIVREYFKDKTPDSDKPF